MMIKKNNFLFLINSKREKDLKKKVPNEWRVRFSHKKNKIVYYIFWMVIQSL